PKGIRAGARDGLKTGRFRGRLLRGRDRVGKSAAQIGRQPGRTPGNPCRGAIGTPGALPITKPRRCGARGQTSLSGFADSRDSPGVCSSLSRSGSRQFSIGASLTLKICGGLPMLRWAILFLVVALIAALFGFTDVAGTSVVAAKILFFVFLVLFVVSLIL